LKVLLVVIDAASPRVVCPAIQTGQLPVMQRLVAAGTLHESSVTIFPSITPAATASIITGAYPTRTGIVGASWYDAAEDQIAYYGDDFWVIAREGFRAFIRDFLIRLNGDRLKAPTLLERVEAAGRKAASINYLVFKGLVEHKVSIPMLLNLLPGVPMTDVVKGPSIFALGDFASTRTMRRKPQNPGNDGLLHRFGMDDAASGELLIELMEDGLPDFTVAYFADNDYRSHKVGPYAALDVVEYVDSALGRAFDAAGGIDRVLQDTYLVITSDHGHCEVLAEADRAAIRLHEILHAFKQAPLGKPWDDEAEIMICPNMRAAQIYVGHANVNGKPEPQQVHLVVDNVLSDPRVDHAIWRTNDTRQAARGYTIRSATGAIEFWKGSDGASHACDQFGTEWTWRGDLHVVDASVSDGQLMWGDYPNAFERIAGALDHPHSATLWLTAKPGCEFEVPGGEAHLGGASHGGLHALESVSPVIVAGPTRVVLPEHFRSIDIAPLCLELLGLTTSARA
jgi:hypothetical protein